MTSDLIQCKKKTRTDSNYIELFNDSAKHSFFVIKKYPLNFKQTTKYASGHTKKTLFFARTKPRMNVCGLVRLVLIKVVIPRWTFCFLHAQNIPYFSKVITRMLSVKLEWSHLWNDFNRFICHFVRIVCVPIEFCLLSYKLLSLDRFNWNEEFDLSKWNGEKI